MPRCCFDSVLGKGAEVIALAACSRFFKLQGCDENPRTRYTQVALFMELFGLLSYSANRHHDCLKAR
jgi:hypothetical protein